MGVHQHPLWRPAFRRCTRPMSCASLPRFGQWNDDRTKMVSDGLGYLLVNVYKKLWKITIFNGKTHHFYGPFSIAMLNYQRVPTKPAVSPVFDGERTPKVGPPSAPGAYGVSTVDGWNGHRWSLARDAGDGSQVEGAENWVKHGPFFYVFFSIFCYLFKWDFGVCTGFSLQVWLFCWSTMLHKITCCLLSDHVRCFSSLAIPNIRKLVCFSTLAHFWFPNQSKYIKMSRWVSLLLLVSFLFFI